jgi:hypothetical protein
MFSFIPQLHKLWRRRTAKSWPKRPASAKKGRTPRLELEALEDRVVAAAELWRCNGRTSGRKRTPPLKGAAR